VLLAGADVEIQIADMFGELFALWPRLRTLHLDFVGPAVPSVLHGCCEAVQLPVPLACGGTPTRDATKPRRGSQPARMPSVEHVGICSA
jgi:hypothetical protein